MGKPLDLQKSVYELCGRYPELIGILSDLGFSDYMKESARTTIGKMLTIPNGAVIKNIDMLDVTAALRREGFLLTGSAMTDLGFDLMGTDILDADPLSDWEGGAQEKSLPHADGGGIAEADPVRKQQGGGGLQEEFPGETVFSGIRGSAGSSLERESAEAAETEGGQSAAKHAPAQAGTETSGNAGGQSVEKHAPAQDNLEAQETDGARAPVQPGRKPEPPAQSVYTFDFTSILDRRGKDAMAVDAIGQPGGFAPAAPREGFDAIPMWVADMNFPTAPSVIKAVQERAAHPAFGYFQPRDEYYDAIIRWQKERNAVQGLLPEHIGYENGVLGGLISALNVLCSRGDSVLVHSPTYIGFTSVLKNNGYRIVHSPLLYETDDAPEKTAGTDVFSRKSSGEKSSGEKASGEKASGEKAFVEKDSGEKSSGEIASREEAAGPGPAGNSSAGSGSAGRWRMDFEDMEEKIRKYHIHAAIFCSPHNPCGRVWTREELEQAYAVFEKYGVTVISDEIWSDLVLNGHVHIPSQSVSEYARNHTVALYAPSKTFNLAGLVGSYHIIYDRNLRERVRREASLSHYNSMNVLSMHALLGAYSEEGARWTDELCRVLGGNVRYATDYIRARFEGVSLAEPEGTYMLFADCRRWCGEHGRSLKDLEHRCWRVGVALQDGKMFGGDTHLRINLALPLSRVQEALDRLDRYVFHI